MTDTAPKDTSPRRQMELLEFIADRVNADAVLPFSAREAFPQMDERGLLMPSSTWRQLFPVTTHPAYPLELTVMTRDAWHLQFAWSIAGLTYHEPAPRRIMRP